MIYFLIDCDLTYIFIYLFVCATTTCVIYKEDLWISYILGWISKCFREEKNMIKPYIARFTLNLGATINMDGTGMYLICLSALLYTYMIYDIFLDMI